MGQDSNVDLFGATADGPQKAAQVASPPRISESCQDLTHAAQQVEPIDLVNIQRGERRSPCTAGRPIEADHTS
jgi:hypothetical protein